MTLLISMWCDVSGYSVLVLGGWSTTIRDSVTSRVQSDPPSYSSGSRLLQQASQFSEINIFRV